MPWAHSKWWKELKKLERMLKVDRDAIEKRLTMLECSHEAVEFYDWSGFSHDDYGKKCSSCGKILATYKNFEEYETARIDHEEAKLAAEKKALLGMQSKGKKK